MAFPLFPLYLSVIPGLGGMGLGSDIKPFDVIRSACCHISNGGNTGVFWFGAAVLRAVLRGHDWGTPLNVERRISHFYGRWPSTF